MPAVSATDDLGVFGIERFAYLERDPRASADPAPFCCSIHPSQQSGVKAKHNRCPPPLSEGHLLLAFPFPGRLRGALNERVGCLLRIGTIDSRFTSDRQCQALRYTMSIQTPQQLGLQAPAQPLGL